jgi:ribosomal protein S6
MQYELLYLVGERNEANLDEIKTGIDAMLTEEGATLGEELVMKKKLAYEIKHEKRGTYVVRRFEMPEYDMWANEAEADHEKGITNLTRKLNLHNELLRNIIVKTDDIPELASLEAAHQQQKQQQQQQRRQDTRRPDDRKGPRQQPKQEVKREVKPEPVEAKEEKEKVKEETKEEVKPEPVEVQKKAEEKEKVEEKSIDKQLEEILNI